MNISSASMRLYFENSTSRRTSRCILHCENTRFQSTKRRHRYHSTVGRSMTLTKE